MNKQPFVFVVDLMASGMTEFVPVGLLKGGIGSRAGRTKFICRVFSICYSTIVYYPSNLPFMTRSARCARGWNDLFEEQG